MTENCTNMCRICLKNDKEDNISDSSCYAKFFIQVCLKNFNETLWLCMWCKAALRRAMALFTLAMESDKFLNSKLPVQTDFATKPKSILDIMHNSHIDIPPLTIEFQDFKTENIIEEIEETFSPLLEIQDDEKPLKRNRKVMKPIYISNADSISNKEHELNTNEIETKTENIIEKMEETNPLLEIHKDEIPLKRNKKIMKSIDISNEDSISNKEPELNKNEIETQRRKNKKEFDFNELKFEVEYLNLEEQFKEVELKKLKYKDFKFQCDECGLGFLTSDVFEEHKVRHTELSGPHKCPICALHFKSPDVLSQHSLAHKRRFKCVLCSNKVSRWSHCVAHRYRCGGAVEPRACTDCAKVFSNEYSLKIHMKVHKTEKKYCCEQCARKFGSKQRLTVHMRSHTGIKPFSCPQCARTFTTRSNLRAHSAVHEHTTQFYCVECHTYYKTAKSLKRHFNESAKHVGVKIDIYSCKECTKHFSTEKSLNYHISTRHGSEHRCTQCDKTFSNNSNLNKHIKCIHTAK